MANMNNVEKLMKQNEMLDRKLKGLNREEWDCDSWSDETAAVASRLSTRKVDEDTMDTMVSELKKDM